MIATLPGLLLERRIRSQHFAPDIAEGAAWNMLLELAAAPSVPVTSLCFASYSPATTALRHLDVLAAHGFTWRRPHPQDKRSHLLAITESGAAAMDGYLAALVRHS